MWINQWLGQELFIALNWVSWLDDDLWAGKFSRPGQFWSRIGLARDPRQFCWLVKFETRLTFGAHSILLHTAKHWILIVKMFVKRNCHSDAHILLQRFGDNWLVWKRGPVVGTFLDFNSDKEEHFFFRDKLNPVVVKSRKMSTLIKV